MKGLDIAKIEYKGRYVDRDGKRYFPVIDIIAQVTGSTDPIHYWANMKQREPQLTKLGRKLQFTAPNGKKYKMDSVDLEGSFRLLQSIPYPKVEPFKLELARWPTSAWRNGQILS